MGDLLELRTVNAVLLSLSFLALGLMVNVVGSSGGGSAEETLEVYPVDLSMAGIHRHDKQFVSEDVPSVEIEAHRDNMMPSHFNLKIETENFSFSPENISDSHVPNRGHAHVYVDDVMISRSYGRWYHIPRLEPGNHTIKVTLNTNNHKEYRTERGIIKDEVSVEVPG